ncbi:GNAT family N-acetyltransferase [Dactylosporangium vinaceum]|uniref:GNAT family N-acetyltransferase n=1 Tax=Dactylosporangium vinaceum TaxID=53362 RepID=A0ABV5M098_9ACTN|nr:GNAT family N-acetyltransferase [Dactylosporangium vinaceum]UAB98164.1 GNAT family N-acetyltransferase [Dactylosporangium vinaceum]
MPASVLQAAPTDLEDALEIWRAANEARGHAPDETRIERVRAKLRAADARVVVVVDGAETVAMGLAEPGRADDGAGAPIPGYGHVSMVFVAPARWGRGLGGLVLDGLHAGGWRRTTLWTRTGNARARRLYEKAGYHPTGRVSTLAAGDGIMQLERIG